MTESAEDATAETADEAFVRSLLESDPKDLPPLPRVAPMTVSEIVDVPTRSARHALVVLNGERGPSWQVCLKRGLFAPGEKVLFVRREILIRDDPRIKDAARTPYRRKKIFFPGGIRKAYIALKASLRPYRANPGAILSLAPFTEFKDVPTGTDVADLIGVTTDAELQKELADRQAAKALHKAEAEAMRSMAAERRKKRLSESRGRSLREEACANGRMCFFGERTPNYVKATELAHLEEHPEYFEQFRETRFDVTEKEDGLNLSLYCARLQDPKRPIHLCVGGQEIRFSDRSYFWRMMLSLGIAERVLESGRNLVMEGVVVGPGFRHGWEDGYRRDIFRVFDIFDLDDDRLLNTEERRSFCVEHGVPMVREVLTDCTLFTDYADMDAVVGLASGKTVRGLPRHGIVARSRDASAPAWFDVSNPGYAKFLRTCGA